MNYSITKNGVCAKHLCVIDEANRTVSTQEIGLLFDFSGLGGWSFKTDSDNTFITGDSCRFGTGNSCLFKTGGFCVFDTGSGCGFETEDGCTFDVDCNCTFKTGKRCVVIDQSSSDLKPFVAPVNVVFNTYDGQHGYISRNAPRDLTVEQIVTLAVNELKRQGLIP